MKAAFIEEFDSIDKIKIGDIKTPQPKENEVQIEIFYAGINPVDWKICEGLLKTRMPHEFPIILGWDAAGIIKKIGSSVNDLKEGDEVFAYCRKNILKEGSFAEYICLEAKNVSKKPQSLSLAQSSCIPLSSLTAWQSLFDTGNLKKNQTILIHAGSGGVGSFAIQFAKLAGAKVITTTSETHLDYVKKLGADIVIDYKNENFVDIIKNQFPQGIDMVYDTLGGKTLKLSYEVIKPNGVLVSIVEVVDTALAKKLGIRVEYVFVRPDKKQLDAIGKYFDEGKMKLPSIEELPLEQVTQGLHKSRLGHVEGKMVLKIH